MNMIKVNGNLKMNRLSLLCTPITLAVLLIADKLPKAWFTPICIAMVITIIIYWVIFFIMEFTPMEVRFDRDWLMTKHLMFKKDIRMEDVSRVQYYINEKKNEGSRSYDLVMEIDHSSGKLKLQEAIKKDEIEYCKTGKAFKELFILYHFIETEYPKKAKGYWRFCGF